MSIYLRVSPKTRLAKKKLEDLGKKSGKNLLKEFLDHERKQLAKQNDTKTVISMAGYTSSNVNKFAKLMSEEANRSIFRQAIEAQAKSLGTKKNGLFYTLIYQNGQLNMENLNLSKIKAFLLATNDTDDINDPDVTDSADKQSHRKKHATIARKLNSSRLSNILKVFMALVLWLYAQKEKINLSHDEFINKFKDFLEHGTPTDFKQFDNSRKTIIGHYQTLKSDVQNSQHELLQDICCEVAWIIYFEQQTIPTAVDMRNPAFITSEILFNFDEFNFPKFFNTPALSTGFSVPFIDNMGILLRMSRQDNIKTVKRVQENLAILQGVVDNLNELKAVSKQVGAKFVDGVIQIIVPSLRKKLEAKEGELANKLKEEKTIENPSQLKYLPYGDKKFSGGFGAVRIYWDTENNCKVAIKTLKDEKPFNKTKIKRAMKVNSPYVAKVIGLIDMNGKKSNGLVMEYVHGGTYLMTAVQKFHKDRKKILEICKQLAYAFKAFSDAGLIHNDLKQHSGNILVDREGNVKIIDYEDTDKGSKSKNIISALNQIGSVLFATNTQLFEDFVSRSGVNFEMGNRSSDFAIGARAHKSSIGEMPSFEKLFKILNDMISEPQTD